MDDISNQYANHTIKLTTRQAFQFHGILKRNLKQSMKILIMQYLILLLHVEMLIVIRCAILISQVHKEINDYATRISNHLLQEQMHIMKFGLMA